MDLHQKNVSPTFLIFIFTFLMNIRKFAFFITIFFDFRVSIFSEKIKIFKHFWKKVWRKSNFLIFYFFWSRLKILTFSLPLVSTKMRFCADQTKTKNIKIQNFRFFSPNRRFASYNYASNSAKSLLNTSRSLTCFLTISKLWIFTFKNFIKWSKKI